MSSTTSAGSGWRKSSYSTYNGNCVEVSGVWERSSRCDGGTCAEVAFLPDGKIGVRDSQDPGGPVLKFTPAAWTAFLEDVKAA